MEARKRRDLEAFRTMIYHKTWEWPDDCEKCRQPVDTSGSKQDRLSRRSDRAEVFRLGPRRSVLRAAERFPCFWGGTRPSRDAGRSEV